MSENKTASMIIKKYAKRWFIDGMGAMALGLFASLIIGLIISQIATIPGLSVLSQFTEVLSAQSPVVGAAIGVAIAYGLKNKPLVIFSSAATGAFGYAMGGPVGAYVAALVGAEIGRLVRGQNAGGYYCIAHRDHPLRMFCRYARRTAIKHFHDVAGRFCKFGDDTCSASDGYHRFRDRGNGINASHQFRRLMYHDGYQRHRCGRGRRRLLREYDRLCGYEL